MKPSFETAVLLASRPSCVGTWCDVPCWLPSGVHSIGTTCHVNAGMGVTDSGVLRTNVRGFQKALVLVLVLVPVPASAQALVLMARVRSLLALIHRKPLCGGHFGWVCMPEVRPCVLVRLVVRCTRFGSMPVAQSD